MRTLVQRCTVLLLAVAVFLTAPGPSGLVLCLGNAPGLHASQSCHADCCPIDHPGDHQVDHDHGSAVQATAGTQDCDCVETDLFASDGTVILVRSQPAASLVALPIRFRWWQDCGPPSRQPLDHLRPSRAPPPTQDAWRAHLAHIRLLI